MEQKILTIAHIKDIGLFKNFTWDDTSIPNFNDVNLFYGRNYSGKTTLSRIFRALETQHLPSKYPLLTFSLKTEDGNYIKSENLHNHNCSFCVFNKDFIKEHLSFIHDDTQNINSFAVLGKENTEIESEIKKLQNVLGATETHGLLKLYAENKTLCENKKSSCDNLEKALEASLSLKATDKIQGIKYKKIFDEQNYNIASLKKDISFIKNGSYVRPTKDEIDKYSKDVYEEKKPILQSFPGFEIKYNKLRVESQRLIEKTIKISVQIPKLIKNANLSKWVDEGRILHKGESECAFCGTQLTNEMLKRLEAHFNKEYELLKKDIVSLISEINTEKQSFDGLFSLKKEMFYSKLHENFDYLNEHFNSEIIAYKKILDNLKQQLEAKLDNIFTESNFLDPSFKFENINSLGNDIEALIERNNSTTDTLEHEQAEARSHLKFAEIFDYLQSILYDEKIIEIEKNKKEYNDQNIKAEQLRTDITQKETEIKALKNQLNDETRGVEIINNFLKKNFGHTSLYLEPKTSTENGVKYIFEIKRNGSRAYNLSEGECSLIAFCYFLARLSSVELHDKKPIICIDDPISSLDYNHIFFIYSIIRSKIIDNSKFTQLFIFTHNLDFLKYLKRLYKESKFNKKCNLYMLERTESHTSIVEMPDYMKQYVSEFIHLFKSIYNCATSNHLITNTSNTYDLGNNIRKFLEIFLHYKYPSSESTTKKINYFLGEDNTTKYLIERIYNEYSHLEGGIERGTLPLDVPEMISVSKLILKRIEETDSYQYACFLNSIGESADKV